MEPKLSVLGFHTRRPTIFVSFFLACPFFLPIPSFPPFVTTTYHTYLVQPSPLLVSIVVQEWAVLSMVTSVTSTSPTMVTNGLDVSISSLTTQIFAGLISRYVLPVRWKFSRQHSYLMRTVICTIRWLYCKRYDRNYQVDGSAARWGDVETLFNSMVWLDMP